MQLFDELGKLFDRELRQSIVSSKKPGDRNAANKQEESGEPNEADYVDAHDNVKSAHDNMNRKIQ